MGSPWRGISTSITDIVQRSVHRAAAAFLAAFLVALIASSAAAAAPLFGAWNAGEPYAGSVARSDTLERVTGRRVNIVNWFQNWGGNSWITSVQSQAVLAVTSSGRTPLLTWEPRDANAGPDQPAFALSAIAGGVHDAYIATFARGLRDLGVAVYLRPMHEMNGSWYPWGAGVNANTPAQFVAAWQRMHHIFAQQGATNVRWVWSPNNYDVSPGYPLEAFYPGGAYVDVLAASGYNWGSARPQFGGWQWFDQVFRNVYERLKALGPQPIWFAEVGAAPDGGDKAAWVRDMFSRAQTMSRLPAIVWFNEHKELDWRADADPAVAAAFAPPPPGVAYPPPPAATEAPPWAWPAPATAPATTLAGTATATGGSGSTTRGGKSRTGAGSTQDAERARAAGADDTQGAAARKRGARLLWISTRTRVRATQRAMLRWKLRSAAGVARWVVYLDGRRVLSVRERRNRSHRYNRRVTALGRHRWRIEGLDAEGRRAIWAVRAFRVVGERRSARR